MGILDDAIREHLELKRQHGADDDDLDRLEKEAFGPPARPGDPEFDTSEGQVVADPQASADVAEAPTTAEPAPAAPASEEAPAEPSEPAEGGGSSIFDAESDSEEDWLASLEDVVESAPAEDQPAAEAPEATPEEPAAEAPEVAAEPAPEPAAEESDPDLGLPSTRPIEDLTPAEQARIEHADLGDTVAHEAVPPPAEEAPAETGEADAPPEAPESAIFDHAGEEFGELDLELDDEEEPAASAEPAAPITDERAVEPEPTSTEMEVPPAPAPPAADEFESGSDDFEIDEEEEDELEDDDEDLLEETPDFLQDAPEGERLWFEQGAPKDFDFEDDDD